MSDLTSFVPPVGEPTTAVNLEDASAANLSFAQQATQTVHETEMNIFIAAQRGEVETIKMLIESGKAHASDRDEQNITPLHWAAINAQVPACRYLLEQGAEVDALGGDLVATPMQWAARNGYLYVIQLLIAHNADPTISDAQGYNTLHLVTHSSSVMPLLYLLHQPISVDSRDGQGHTSLMWAAYQGDALSVDLLLKHGADPNTRDESELTPLHWAVVKGNRNCIRKLVEKGADLTAKNREGKTPRDMAAELKSLGAWKRALEEGGMLEDGAQKQKPLSERNTKLAIFLMPTFFFYLMFTTLKVMPWYTGILLAMAEFFAMHHIVTRVLLNTSSYTDSVIQSPYYAGIISGSMVWVAYCWVTRLLHQTQHHPFVHLTFALAYGLCAYNFVRSITLDAGTCPKPANEGELRATVEDLASEGRLNGQTFCIQCMARKPLRSKHCRVCDKCVARHDHHCPWVWNCVGVNNHRQFILFVTTLVIGIILFDYLAYAYFSTIDALSESSSSCLLPDELCAITAYDPFLFAVVCWSTLQLLWTTVLLTGQLYQITRQMTTFEVSNLGRFGFMGGRGGSSLASQMGHRHQHAPLGGGGSGGVGDEVQPHKHQHVGCGGMLMQLTGFDAFTKGRAADGLARAGKAANPFDAGIVGNCTDFWTTGRELGVEYARLYDVPLEGFREAKRRREKDEEEDGAHGTRKARGQFMGFSLGIGRGSRAGYEPVSQV
ncbi:hypothetical protein M0805_009257 [Coniferiporia weirii]|nr:hypothetical protein M0805_009257 [Coniferiporia weirii]